MIPYELETRHIGAGKPLVAIHGIQSTMDCWLPVVEKLHGWQTVLVNLPGRGNSPRWKAGTGSPSDFYNLDRYADLVHELITSIGSPVSLAGWSMGVSVALNIVKRHGLANIEQLFLFSGVARMPEEAWPFHSSDVQGLCREADNRLQNFHAMPVADSIAVAYSWLSMRNMDLRPALGEIDCPVTIIHGVDDRECPLAQGKEIADRIKRAVMVPVEGVGHYVLRDIPGTIADVVQSRLPAAME
ncbi:alpha/beta hydrolase [Alcaligenaceae bacterium]|nr:alpha/beta hydrolase [Alcaligenaceae bacterium]